MEGTLYYDKHDSHYDENIFKQRTWQAKPIAVHMVMKFSFVGFDGKMAVRGNPFCQLSNMKVHQKVKWHVVMRNMLVTRQFKCQNVVSKFLLCLTELKILVIQKQM